MTVFTVVFTSVGRRRELVDIFRSGIRSVGLEPNLVGIDHSPLAPALHGCDEIRLAPRVEDPGYADFLLKVMTETQANLLVPLIDTELALQAGILEELERAGAVALISEKNAIAITADKYLTWKFFDEAGVPTPNTKLPGQDVDEVGLPLIVKPRQGSSSQDVYVCTTAADRDHRLATVGNPIAQQLARGVELTIDALCDLDSKLINAVVRERLRTRGGESTIGVTVDAPDVLEWIERIAAHLRPRGPFTVQCFRDDDDSLLFTEINCRFGGGYPLADAAGADYPALVTRMCRGEVIEPCIGRYDVGIAMSRYDRSVFFPIEEGAGGAHAWSSETHSDSGFKDDA